MRRLFAAVAFLTRWPVPVALDAADVGRGALLFPAVGALLGALAGGAAWALGLLLPPWPTAVLLTAILAVATGAMHLDGLADMADGFGGGRTRDDVLRIMRDHVIGAYGGVALVLLLSLKIASLATLVGRGQAFGALVAAGALSRWASVPLGRALPYARASGGLGQVVTEHVGALELWGATALAGGAAVWFLGVRGLVAWGAVCASTSCVGWLCARRIGGVTGDTLGANTEVAEAVVYLVAVAAP